jgi:hypothetical protein
MKKLLCLCVALTLMFPSLHLFAATDVTGTWVGQFAMPDGSATFPLSFTFKQDGTTVTGSIANPQGGDPIAITDGKLDGDKISFRVSFNGMNITHSGTVTGDEMKLDSKSDSADFPGGQIVLKRAKPATATP